MLEASQSITLADVKAFGDELFKALNIVILSHGNVNQDEAVALAKAVQANLLGDAEIVTVDRASVVQLGPGDLVHVDLQITRGEMHRAWRIRSDDDFRTRLPILDQKDQTHHQCDRLGQSQCCVCFLHECEWGLSASC